MIKARLPWSGNPGLRHATSFCSPDRVRIQHIDAPADRAAGRRAGAGARDQPRLAVHAAGPLQPGGPGRAGTPLTPAAPLTYPHRRPVRVGDHRRAQGPGRGRV